MSRAFHCIHPRSACASSTAIPIAPPIIAHRASAFIRFIGQIPVQA